MLARIVVAVFVVLGACNPDAPEPVPGVVAATGSDSAADWMATPTIDGAKLLGRTTRDRIRAITTWCIDEHDAVERVMAALRRDGWTDVRSRGEGERIGIAASRGTVRFSATAGGHHERCAGTLVIATVMRLGSAGRPIDDTR